MADVNIENIAHKPNPKTQDVKLSKNSPIIAHTINEKFKILDLLTFIITDINEEYLNIKNDDVHQFFSLEFCIAIHASQEETKKVKNSTIHD